jgi:hypothetical protein
MKRICLWIACGSLAFVLGCAADASGTGDDENPHNDKAPSTDLAHVSPGQSDTVVSAPAPLGNDVPVPANGPAGTPGAAPRTHF